MSIRLMSKAWEMDIPQGQKMVLLALCDHANDDGNCYPSQEKLAKKASTTGRSIIRHIDWLEKHGIIATERRQKNGRRLSDLYQISLENYTKSLPDNLSPDKKDIANLTISTELPDNLSPSFKEEPSVNHQDNHNKESIKEKKLSPVDILVDDYHLPKQLSEDWLLVRKGKQAKPPTKTAMDGVIREADKAGLTLEQAITISVERNWTGFAADWLHKPTYSGKPEPFDPIAENNKNRTSRQKGQGYESAIDGECTRLA